MRQADRENWSGEIRSYVKFKSVAALVGWAFQVSESVPVKVQRFSDVRGAEFDALSPDQLKMLAVDVLAKVSRLPDKEQAVLAAYFAGDVRAVKKAAALVLPAGWAQPMRIELARCWANDQQLERSQEEMASAFMLSQPTVHRRKKEAFQLMSKVLDASLAVIEVQTLDLVERKTYRNSAREEVVLKHACQAA